MEQVSNSAHDIVFKALSETLAPDPIVKPSEWARDTMIVADGPKAGEKWDPSLTPQLIEILDCLSFEHPCNRISVRKSHQVGFTEVLKCGAGNLIVNTPTRAMIVFPTINAVQDFNREKLQPTIEATAVLRKKLNGSTALSKAFAGGSIVLTGANSAADLRSKTVKVAFCDEIDEWPLDLDGQGDPMEMVDARQTSFHATGEYKKLEGSTPTIKGSSQIDEAFEEGDQRHYNVQCPHCGTEQKLEFGSKDTKHGLKFNKQPPYNAYYVCVEGCVIEHHHKRKMVMNGRWIAERPNEGRHPSFHLDTLTSLLTTWDKLAEKFLKAKGKARKLKAFVNLWLGQSWEEKGEVPEWKTLLLRRESYPARTLPVGALVITCAVDVQMDGLFYEVLAHGRDGKSWSIDVGFLTGATADPKGDVWKKLTDVYNREYPDAYGNKWPVDLMGVDSGFNTTAVYAWVRRFPKAMALKGQGGWGHAAIASSPNDVDVTFKGKKKRRGLKVWHVGTWSLKSELYADLRKEGRRDGQELDPEGYCYFSDAIHDDVYFKQLTAEFLKDVMSKGRTRREWVASGPNHYHDCRVYNMALAEHLGVSVMTETDWINLSAIRTAPPENGQVDMLDTLLKPEMTDTTPQQDTHTNQDNYLDDYVDRDWLED